MTLKPVTMGKQPVQCAFEIDLHINCKPATLVVFEIRY